MRRLFLNRYFTNYWRSCNRFNAASMRLQCGHKVPTIKSASATMPYSRVFRRAGAVAHSAIANHMRSAQTIVIENRVTVEWQLLTPM